MINVSVTMSKFTESLLTDYTAVHDLVCHQYLSVSEQLKMCHLEELTDFPLQISEVFLT